MAPDNGTRLTGIWFLASFLWLSYSLNRHTLINQPRLASSFLLLISGSLVFATSLFAKWLPGADGRFDSDAVLKASTPSLPPRPRRFYVPCIVGLVILRLEFSYVILNDFQCSKAGVETFLPLLLAIYKFISHRPPPVISDEPEDLWKGPIDDLKEWLEGSPFGLLLGSAALSAGAYIAANFAKRTTYFCSPLIDQGAFVLFAQLAGVVVDAVIIVLSWRVLSWTRTTRGRLRALGGILLSASIVTYILLLVSEFFPRDGEEISSHSSGTIKLLYIYDALGTGLVLASLVISATLMLCDTSPLEPVAIATFASGILTSISGVLLVGTYQQTTATLPPLASGLVSFGFMVFVYATNMRSVFFIRRVFFLLLLIIVVIASIIRAAIVPKVFKHHPVDELVYQSRVEADRWLRHATVSTTLKLAVQEYEERHHGRKPPRNFDKWFEFAQQKKSVIIDQFDQIERDILPFWALKPQTIRESVEFLKTQPKVGIIRIANGKASYTYLGDASERKVLDEIVNLISGFVEHLPRMEMAINLDERPKVLVSWNKMSQLRKIATQPGFQTYSGRLGKWDDIDLSAVDDDEFTSPSELSPYMSASYFRQLQALACPPGSPTRGGIHWDVRDFCSSCTVPHSKHQFLEDWQVALDPCHQPDLFNLHEFYTLPHQTRLYGDLLPLFSASKTSNFGDIIIPFPRPGYEQEYDGKTFNQKLDILLWQGDVNTMPPAMTHETIHGSHRLRLIHLVKNATEADMVPMLLGIGSGENSRFRYEDVPTIEGNSVLPLQFSLTNPSGDCDDQFCAPLRDEFGLEPPVTDTDSRYAMLLDTSNGPPNNLRQVLGSNRVPVLASIFQEWFTERLRPWVHFIPIDLRYHALHSTMSYFIGLDGHGSLNGRNQITPSREEDAKWIAAEGRKWAEKAIRREDMEIYLFRLLLEWGRVTDDNRDELGFVLKDA